MNRQPVYCIVMYALYLSTTSLAAVSGDREHDMYRKLERERETAILRNRILQHIENNGAKFVYFKDQYEQKKADNQVLSSRVEQDVSPSRYEPLLVISQPASNKRDRCLMFKVSKIKNIGGVAPFSPIRINLWIYLRKTSRSKDNKKRKNENKVARNSDIKKIKPTNKKKSDKKRKRKRNGRRIKLFVTNGSEKLTTTRMNIDLKGWYKIELPVSRLLSEISKNDNFKLCFKCKRCKRYKMVLYRKDSKDINVKAPRIPFIEFETVRSRSRRSTDVTINKRRHHHSSRGHAHFVRAVNDSCCEEVIYKQDITAWFPNILYPSTINFSTCGATFNSSSYKPLLSQTNTDLRETTSVDNAKCIPRSYENFSFLFIDKKNDLKTGDIPNLIPNGCVCQQTLSLNH